MAPHCAPPLAMLLVGNDKERKVIKRNCFCPGGSALKPDAAASPSLMLQDVLIVSVLLDIDVFLGRPTVQ